MTATVKRTEKQFAAKGFIVGSIVQIESGPNAGRYGKLDAIQAGYAYVTDAINRQEMIACLDQLKAR